MNIGIALRYYRKISGLTQMQLAEKADINEKYYGELESDQSSPTINRLEKICMALGIQIQQIVSYKKLSVVNVENKQIKIEASVTEFYCNCCGTSFYTQDEEVICPVCGCEYSEENNYIEKYG